MEKESDGDGNFKRSTWNNPQRIVKETGRLGNKRTNGDHPKYSIFEIGPNTKTSPGDLSRLAVTQTPVKAHQQTLTSKIRKE